MALLQMYEGKEEKREEKVEEEERGREGGREKQLLPPSIFLMGGFKGRRLLWGRVFFLTS
jgi:hypothetical protein